jgi:hypothetical protein
MIPVLTQDAVKRFEKRAYGRIVADGGTITNDYTGVLRQINAIVPIREIEENGWLYTAQGKKTGTAYALAPTNGTGDLAYTGSAGRYFQRNDGLFVASQTNLPPLTKDGIASWQGGTKYAFPRDLTNAQWVKSGTSIALKDQIGIDGIENSACSFEATANNDTVLRTQTLASGARATSFFIKRLIGTGTISITINGGTAWVDVTSQINATNYVRVNTSATVTNPQYGIRLGTSGDKIAVDFAELQSLGMPLLPPIDSGASSVTFPADITTDTDSPQAIKDATELTMFWRGVVPQFVNGAAQQFLHLANNTTAVGVTDVISFLKSGESNQLRVATRLNSGTNVAVDFGSINALSGQMLNIAVRAKNNDYAISFNATATQTDATNVYSANRAKISLGMRNSNDLQINGYTELAFIKSGGLTNAELQALSGVGL